MGAAQDLPFGFSPQPDEFEDQFDPLKSEEDDYALGDDDLDEQGLFGEEQDLDGSLEGSSSSASGSQMMKKKRTNNRKGPHNADKRATHNAVERKRRESLNTRFIDLAKALPTTKHIKRPSKAVIVSKALDYVYDASAREHALTKENNELRCEVDQLRIRLGLPPLPPPVGLPEHRAATQSTLRKNRKESTVPPEVSSLQDSARAAMANMVACAAPAPTTPLDESPAGSSSFFGTHAASPSSISSATPSSTASQVFDTTSPDLVSAAGYPPFFSAPPELGGSPAEVSLGLGPAMASGTPFFGVSTGVPLAYHSQAAAAYTAAVSANPALVHQLAAAGMYAGAPQSATAHQFNPSAAAYLNPHVLLALQQQAQAQAQAHAHASPQAQSFVSTPEWLLTGSPPQVAGPTSMFAASF